MKHRNALLQC